MNYNKEKFIKKYTSLRMDTKALDSYIRFLDNADEHLEGLTSEWIDTGKVSDLCIGEISFKQIYQKEFKIFLASLRKMDYFLKNPSEYDKYLTTPKMVFK